ncbi:MAG: nucleotidyltransferase domain-containing protein [Candidatus Latescibacterota bacterium]
MTADHTEATSLPASLAGTVDHVVSTIARACHPYQIIVFGSAANGRWTADSDLDLLVVMDSDLPRHRRAAPLHLLFDPYPCPMDILVYTPAELARWRHVPGHIVAEVLRTGTVVYERA